MTAPTHPVDNREPETADSLLVPGRGGQIRRVSDPSGLLRALVASAHSSHTHEPCFDGVRRDFPELTTELFDRAVDALRRIGAITADADPGRNRNNERFFDLYAGPGAGPAVQHRLSSAHVAILGAGGVGSSVLANLAGLGVTSYTIVDNDVVEASNLNRAFLYHHGDIGRPKVHVAAERVQAANPEAVVHAIHRRVDTVADVHEVIDGADIVVVTLDEPVSIRWRVNQACVDVSTPFIAGGAVGATAAYFAVDPSRSACLECLGPDPADAGLGSAFRNTSIGPLTTMLGGAMSLEAMRMLTDITPAAATGRMWTIGAATGAVEEQSSWNRQPDCPVCA